MIKNNKTSKQTYSCLYLPCENDDGIDQQSTVYKFRLNDRFVNACIRNKYFLQVNFKERENLGNKNSKYREIDMNYPLFFFSFVFFIRRFLLTFVSSQSILFFQNTVKFEKID